MQPPLQRLAEKVELSAHPSADDHQLGVEHRGDGRHHEGQPLRQLVHRGARRQVASARGLEHLAGRHPRRHPQLHRGAHDRPGGGGLLEGAPAIAEGLGRCSGDVGKGEVGDLAGGAAAADVEPAVDDHAHAEPGPDQEVDEGRGAPAPPVGELSQGREVGVVADAGGIPQLAAKLIEKCRAAPAANPGGKQEGSVGGIEDTRAGDGGPNHLGPSHARLGGDLAGQPADAAHHR